MKHLDVPSFFPNGAPLASKRLVAETGQDEASSCEQACPLGGGFLTFFYTTYYKAQRICPHDDSIQTDSANGNREKLLIINLFILLLGAL